MATVRYPVDSDLPLIEAALQQRRARMVADGREWSSHFATDITAVVDSLMENCSAIIVGDYLLVFQIIEGWLMPGARFFDEVLVLRITQQEGNSLRSVVDTMDRIARDNFCVGIQVGTYGADDERLARVYQKMGFKTAAAQLYKEV